jgi:hypothetical protein
MALASSALSGPNLSNGSIGTRLGSASDWIRTKRITAVRQLLTQQAKEVSVATTPSTKYGKALLIPQQVGVSKIQRPASRWTDYKAALYGDFVTGAKSATSSSVTLTRETTCNCTKTTLNPKLTGCKVCSVSVSPHIN